MKKSAKILTGIPVGFLLIGIAYYQLGGFRPVDVAIVDCTDMILVGREFRGTPQDELLGRSFGQVEDVKRDNYGAILHTIYYTEPEGKRDTMHVFVGVQKAMLPKPIPKMTEKEVTCTRAVVAKIHAHRFVMPSPLRIKKKMVEFAAENGVVLQDIFVDKLFDDSHVEVWAPLIEE